MTNAPEPHFKSTSSTVAILIMTIITDAARSLTTATTPADQECRTSHAAGNIAKVQLTKAPNITRQWNCPTQCIAMRNGLAFRKHTGATFFGLLKSALAMSKDDDMTASQAIMSANAPMIIQKAMVDGEPAAGVLPSGQVAGVIDELLTCEALIESIVAEAERRLVVLAARAAH